MNIDIQVSPKQVEKGNFNYSNIDSRYSVNTQYFMKDGEPYTIIAGELHYSRVPRYRWKETLLKMRALGLNTVSTYVFWNYHEEEKGNFDFTGNNDVAEFLRICKSVNMPCILRIGPWCHGEVVRGGFPKRIDKLKGKRSNNEKYLNEVRDFWTRLYDEVEPFLDGESVNGIQLENEYNGSIDHIKALRKIAEEIGYKTPFFTMTAWPTGKADNDFLPMFGGYPDAPWSSIKAPLKPNNRFAIAPNKVSEEIGMDLHTNKTANTDSFASIPYASCEIGPGNQVTQHRRPYISTKDGYGVGFAKFASGVNFLGYYMFCGGANPNTRLLQESKKTGYPNNYQIIDYDFQAPISRYGVVKPHGHLLRLMHLFTKEFDKNVCTKQVFFPNYNYNNPADISFLKCSVRMNENGEGYFFSGAYEKSIEYKDFKDVNVHIKYDGKQIDLPTIDVKAGSMFFYPFNLTVDDVKFDYILAQPIAKVNKDGETVCYFMECEGLEPWCCIDGVRRKLEIDDVGIKINNVRVIVLSRKEAMRLYVFDGKPHFSSGTVYKDHNKIYCEQVTDNDLKSEIAFKECSKKKLPYDYYLYSRGRRTYYELRLPKDILENRFDVALEFYFEGLNLQVFSGNTLINDYFNIDKKFVMNLRDYKEYLEKDNVLIIKAVPKTKFGVSNVYNEIPIPLRSTKMHIISAKVIERNEIRI